MTKPAARTVAGTCPLDCPDTCSWQITVQDGAVVGLSGNRAHPYTRGTLCVKLNGFVDYLHRPDRLLHPLRRVGPKGSGRFARVSWDEALDELADRWRTIIAEYGAEAIWPYYGTGSMGMLQGLAGSGRRLWNVLGTSQHQMTICTIAGGVGTGYTLGHNQVGMVPETLSQARLIVLWGTNTLSTNHHLWRVIANARRDNSARLVVIDPVRTRTAERADLHLAPIPGTDAALALGLMHVIVGEGREDRDFIAAHTVGWPALRGRILEYPPARVAAITGLPQAAIESLGHEIAVTRPTGIRTAMGLQRHGGGGMAVRTITCLAGVTGDWRYPGGGVSYDTRGFFPGNWPALWREDLRPAGTRKLSMTRLAEGLLDVDDPPVKSLFVYAANPLASVPDQARVRRGLARDDLFTVVVEHVETDTTDYADLVLPGAMQPEQMDLHHAYGHVYLHWNEPAVPPPGECRPHSEIFRAVARRLGLLDPCLHESDEDMARAVLDSDELRRHGITLERLRADGWVRLPVADAPFAAGFPTPSGKLEFFSERMAADGHDPVAGYTPPHETVPHDPALADRYPLCLIATAAHALLNSTFADWPPLAERQGELVVLLHPDDAAARGLAAGDRARVYNGRGEFVGRIAIGNAVRPGVAAASKGHWPRLETGRANANATVAERDSDMGGGVFHDNRVEIEKLPAA